MSLKEDREITVPNLVDCPFISDTHENVVRQLEYPTAYLTSQMWFFGNEVRGSAPILRHMHHKYSNTLY